jgi:hypothetical protein
MIANDEQLQLVNEQVATLESALESLAKTVRPRSEMQYRVFAEGYVDQLAILRADIDAYFGTASARNSEPEIEVSVEAPTAERNKRTG